MKRPSCSMIAATVTFGFQRLSMARDYVGMRFR
jgi:hypothetical protein